MIHWKYCLIIIVVFISCFTLVKHTEKISKKSKIILQNLDFVNKIFLKREKAFAPENWNFEEELKSILKSTNMYNNLVNLNRNEKKDVKEYSIQLSMVSTKELNDILIPFQNMSWVKLKEAEFIRSNVNKMNVKIMIEIFNESYS